jgi:hypothetical protein
MAGQIVSMVLIEFTKLGISSISFSYSWVPQCWRNSGRGSCCSWSNRNDMGKTKPSHSWCSLVGRRAFGQLLMFNRADLNKKKLVKSTNVVSASKTTERLATTNILANIVTQPTPIQAIVRKSLCLTCWNYASWKIRPHIQFCNDFDEFQILAIPHGFWACLLLMPMQEIWLELQQIGVTCQRNTTGNHRCDMRNVVVELD